MYIDLPIALSHKRSWTINKNAHSGYYLQHRPPEEEAHKGCSTNSDARQIYRYRYRYAERRSKRSTLRHVR